MNTSPHPSKDRWLHASALQKAIRRNLPDLAIPSACFLWEWNPRYLMRRLAVIAFEDIGLANLDLIERYLDSAHPVLKEGRFGGGEREQVMDFVRAFCVSPKSRYLTRIGATCHYHPQYKALTAAYHTAILTDKVQAATQETDILRAQAIALTCHPSELEKVLLAEGHPQLACLMLLGNRLGCEGLPHILFATRNELPVETIPTPLPSPLMLRGFPNWAYDKHTRLGGRALRLFIQQVPELSCLTQETALWFAYRVLFRYESGLLHEEVMFTHNNEVEVVWWETLCVEGLTLQDVFRLREVLRHQLPLLDAIRCELLGNPS